MASDSSYEPSYRQKSVDGTLDEHEKRITRLEKAGLIVLGYSIAEGSGIVETFAAFL